MAAVRRQLHCAPHWGGEGVLMAAEHLEAVLAAARVSPRLIHQAVLGRHWPTAAAAAVLLLVLSAAAAATVGGMLAPARSAWRRRMSFPPWRPAVVADAAAEVALAHSADKAAAQRGLSEVLKEGQAPAAAAAAAGAGGEEGVWVVLVRLPDAAILCTNSDR